MELWHSAPTVPVNRLGHSIPGVAFVPLGWQINGITILQGGTPFNLSMNTDAANTSSQGPQRPDVLKTPVYNCGAGHLLGCIDKSAFAVPGNIAQGIFTYGNAGRNILRGPHLFDTDMSLFKSFQLKERLRFTVRAEAFNVWNRCGPRRKIGRAHV